MNFLIIDNGTSYLKSLQALLSGHNFTIIKYSEIDLSKINDFNAIILSGGHDFSVVGNEDKLEKEFELVRNCNKPILGICFGFEVIAQAFGATLKRLSVKEKNIIDIQVVHQDQIFQNLPNFKVFENHRWVVETGSVDLITLATSQDGIEAIKHQSKPIYGIQFRPEMFVNETCGDEVFGNFVRLV